MKRLAPAPGARKLALAGVRRRRVPISEWERRDVQERVMRTGYKVDCLRDLAHETWQMAMETHHNVRFLSKRLGVVDWCVRLVVGVLAAAASVATMHLVFPA